MTDGVTQKATATSATRDSAAETSGWLTAAAVFWFAAWGVMGLVLIGLVPLIGFMHATYPPASWTDGSLLWLSIALLSVLALSGAAWALGSSRRRMRSSLFVVLGSVGIVAIATTAVVDPAALLPVAFWLGWPSVSVVSTWGRRLSG